MHITKVINVAKNFLSYNVLSNVRIKIIGSFHPITFFILRHLVSNMVIIIYFFNQDELQFMRAAKEKQAHCQQRLLEAAESNRRANIKMKELVSSSGLHKETKKVKDEKVRKYFFLKQVFEISIHFNCIFDL